MGLLEYVQGSVKGLMLACFLASCGPEAANGGTNQGSLTEEQLVGAGAINSYYAGIDRSCGSDRGCALKNVGNCCGAYGMCVSADAETNPGYVLSVCGQYELSGECGYPSIDACACVDDKCASFLEGKQLSDDLVDMPWLL